MVLKHMFQNCREAQTYPFMNGPNSVKLLRTLNNLIFQAALKKNHPTQIYSKPNTKPNQIPISTILMWHLCFQHRRMIIPINLNGADWLNQELSPSKEHVSTTIMLWASFMVSTLPVSPSVWALPKTNSWKPHVTRAKSISPVLLWVLTKLTPASLVNWVARPVCWLLVPIWPLWLKTCAQTYQTIIISMRVPQSTVQLSASCTTCTTGSVKAMSLLVPSWTICLRLTQTRKWFSLLETTTSGILAPNAAWTICKTSLISGSTAI